MQEFAEKYYVTSAHFTAIGAVNGATLGWFDPKRKMYKEIPIHGQHEVIGMSGDMVRFQGKPIVHTHMVVGYPDGTTCGGHVLGAYLSPTLEVMLTVDSIAMHKRFDPETDLTLILQKPPERALRRQTQHLQDSREHGLLRHKTEMIQVA